MAQESLTPEKLKKEHPLNPEEVRRKLAGLNEGQRAALNSMVTRAQEAGKVQDAKPEIVTTRNLELHPEEGYLVASVNPKIYPLLVIYSASHRLIERAYVLIGGNPNTEVSVEIRPKEKAGLESLEALGREFNNSLLVEAVAASKKQGAVVEKKASGAFKQSDDDRGVCP